MFRAGHVSLSIGFAFLAGAFAASHYVGRLLPPRGFGGLLREGVIIGGWVAMWRPLGIFLYDWWPVLAEARLCDRLAAMPVRIRYSGAAASDDWQRDWPATAAAGPAGRRNP